MKPGHRLVTINKCLGAQVSLDQLIPYDPYAIIRWGFLFNPSTDQSDLLYPSRLQECSGSITAISMHGLGSSVLQLDGGRIGE